MAHKESIKTVPVLKKPVVGLEVGIFNNNWIGLFLQIERVGNPDGLTLTLQYSLENNPEGWYNHINEYGMDHQEIEVEDSWWRADNPLFKDGDPVLSAIEINPPAGAKLARVVALGDGTAKHHYIVTAAIGWNHED